jgi:hypothetical protein
MLVNIEIATAAFGGLAMTYFNIFFGGLAMTYKCPLCHCEESRQCRDDEAIPTLATSPKAGIQMFLLKLFSVLLWTLNIKTVI